MVKPILFQIFFKIEIIVHIYQFIINLPLELNFHSLITLILRFYTQEDFSNFVNYTHRHIDD